MSALARKNRVETSTKTRLMCPPPHGPAAVLLLLGQCGRRAFTVLIAIVELDLARSVVRMRGVDDNGGMVLPKTLHYMQMLLFHLLDFKNRTIPVKACPAGLIKQAGVVQMASRPAGFAQRHGGVGTSGAAFTAERDVAHP